MSAHRTTLGSIVFATAAVLAVRPAAGQAVIEEISFVYHTIEWAYAKPKIEADFRRVVNERGLKLSAAEVAGAAQAAFDGGVEFEDSWEQQTIIRGCGPRRQLCFVITCNSCRAR
jgi:hypothetical protein